TGVAEIEIKEGEESVRISRNPSGATFAMMPQHMMYGPPPAPAAAPAAAVVTPAAAAAAVAAALAKNGDPVEFGQPLFVIE
ncbi:MAG: acetyl-CoA carboxylase biotin carboxyl carrier protein, partial [Proteobacteria bacterium]|nr:acetyl-CoA carboxylase biotin carboxyl carrier protein [Pseudomonadota bacterium]